MKYLITILLFLSCNKPMQQDIPVSGVLPDAPNNAQVLISEGFIKPTSSTTFALRGKPLKGDRSAPSVSFLNPTGGTSVGGSVLISILATDNVGVTATSISINGIKVASGTSYQWNTAGYESGLHTITATASDAAGNTRSISISVTINAIIVDPPPNPSTEVSLKMPPVANQGSEGTCVAFSVGYAARSADWYYRTGATSYSFTTNVFSPEHLYNQVKFEEGCLSGTAMQIALDYIIANGIVTYASMPYTSGDCSLQPTAAQIAEATTYKISGYNKIYTTDRAMIRSMINGNKPVIISIAGDQSFITAKTGFVWRVYSGSGYIAHSVVICGYDDSKNAWKIMNSFGTGWGDAGYSWIDYDFFPTRTGTWCYTIM